MLRHGTERVALCTDDRQPHTLLDQPFMQLSFQGLSVMPELRLTDLGLVDVNRFEVTSVGP